jgi:hypothetical protein
MTKNAATSENRASERAFISRALGLTRTRSATAGQGERGLEWKCFHKVKPSENCAELFGIYEAKMIRAWLLLKPRVIGEQLPAPRFAHSRGNHGRTFVISSTRFQPSKYCPRTEPILENCGTPTLRFGEALDFCLPVRPRRLVSWPAAFQITIKNNAESSSFDLLRNVFSERFQSNIPCTLGFPAVVAPGPTETV